MKKPQKWVEVFKTNVNNESSAFEIIKTLKSIFPNYKVNFDLEDCDNILRVESTYESIEVKKIIAVVDRLNFEIEVLE
jgi:hypothetical protein